VLAVDASSELVEQGNLNFLKFDRVGDIQDFLNLVKEHDFLGGVDLWPVLEKTHHDFLCECRILFEELDDAIGQLWVIQG